MIAPMHADRKASYRVFARDGCPHASRKRVETKEPEPGSNSIRAGLWMLRTSNRRRFYRHGIVSRIIIPPHFRQPPASLNWEKQSLRWLGSFGLGFLSPQPPGVVGTGPTQRPHGDQRELVLFYLWAAVISGRSRPRAKSGIWRLRHELPGLRLRRIPG
jgi:hypothetical protein